MTKASARARRAAGAPPDEEAILRVAARLFREQGYERTTEREVARAAGILPGSLHYRFPAKEDLLLELMRRAVAGLAVAVRAALEGIGDPVEHVRRALRAHMRVLLAGGDAVPVLLSEWRTLRGAPRREMVRLRDEYEALWEGLLQAAAGAVALRPGVDLRLLRLLGFGALNGAAGWYRPGGPQTPESIADAFFDWIRAGVLVPPPAEEDR
jgi:AcrR family transcriptional regulator